ncbi:MULTISPECIES: DUF2569 domain-containing protein [Brevibacillus]|uniref:DUF2569 domain-containing protein n=1 Tax=Brevibacillus TaxID=55080 RepID=UPI001E615D71|nr:MULTISPECIES: DUF2569 domain-containing protein [Brevibacillus]MED1945635.1 DUF2569 domain-containing protein [Brevibacillus formosus]MED2000732.1 DUF2569 domain-containing protein [Brevibacillus formosus]MED2084422.1 DUF2569 domain-containing protein [Brevibacillus formosus]
MVVLSPLSLFALVIRIFQDYAEEIEGLQPFMEQSMSITLYYYGNILLEVGLLAFSLTLLVFYFRKKKRAPHLFVGLILFYLILNMIDLLAWASFDNLFGDTSQYVKQSGLSLLHTCITAMIWVPYFRLSERVKNTFVNE